LKAADRFLKNLKRIENGQWIFIRKSVGCFIFENLLAFSGKAHTFYNIIPRSSICNSILRSVRRRFGESLPSMASY